jgi:biotin carboxyl carrier protein
MLEVTVPGYAPKQVVYTQENQSVTLNGVPVDCDIQSVGNGFHMLINNQSHTVYLVSYNSVEKKVIWKINGKKVQVSFSTAMDLLLRQLGMEKMNTIKVSEVKAPMPGLIRNILVQPGDAVTKGQGLLVLEAMKMENVLKSPADGKIKSIKIEIGQAVEKNQVLIFFE